MPHPLTSFPTGFLWGAATAAHQTEGNNVNTDSWMAENAVPPRFAERSGDACDSYHRWPDDLDIVRDLGLGAYRFSIEWARVEPEPGHFSQAEIAHYSRMVQGCLERGITPVVTLHHFSSPRWFRRDGAWTSASAADRFARYVEAVLPALDGVHWICTINEPNMVAMAEARLSAEQHVPAAPGVPALSDEAFEGLASAHRAAREVLAALPGVRSGWTVANQNVTAVDGADELADRVRNSVDDRFLDVGRSDDFIGVQAYSRMLIGPDGLRKATASRQTQMGWEFYPAALAEAVRHTAARVGDVPILVTENGIATPDDSERIEYTQLALEGLRAAMEDGIDVRGYLHWSLLDNYEWGSWDATFGLVAVDRTDFRRTVKSSGRWYGQVAQTNGAILSESDQTAGALR
ncbi:family 1 glycosylhydrolase [Microbacterium sp.]|uniref:glycoside hydrolase family 1 protein n=1 Tax=Microbacterium sp. TaxID=51671 RepID=UPI0028121311|nr:family 1 glycosylhydrolase [Microbacterium sp.]